jgi:hypothetical protein
MLTFGKYCHGAAASITVQGQTMTTTPGKYWILCAALAAGFVTVPASAMGMGQASGTNQGNGGALYSGIGPSATRPAECLAQFVP